MTYKGLCPEGLCPRTPIHPASDHVLSRSVISVTLKVREKTRNYSVQMQYNGKGVELTIADSTVDYCTDMCVVERPAGRCNIFPVSMQLSEFRRHLNLIMNECHM